MVLDEEERRERRDSHYTTVSYECDECSFFIEGHSGDPQESPWLYCPECGQELHYAIE